MFNVPLEIISWLYQGLRFHTQREDRTNPTSIQPTKRNRSSNNDSLQKHQSERTFTRWRHRILRHCCRSTARRHASPYLFIICLDYVLRTSINKIRENGFELTKKRSRRYPAKTITDADYADDIALLANMPNQAETLLHSLEQAATGIGLHVNAHKTEYMCYNQTGNITILDRTSLKLVDKFTYLGSSISSTEKDIDTQLMKACTLSIGSRSYGNQTWPIKWNAVSSRQWLYRYCYMDALHGR